MHNLYKGNAEKMGEWATASHIERKQRGDGAKSKKQTQTGSPPKA
jgi:hypothetical protein